MQDHNFEGDVAMMLVLRIKPKSITKQWSNISWWSKVNYKNHKRKINNLIRGGSRVAATSKMEHFVIIVNGYYHKALHLGVCSSPRYTSAHHGVFFYWFDLISNVLSSFIQEDMHKMKERALQWNEAFRPNII